MVRRCEAGPAAVGGALRLRLEAKEKKGEKQWKSELGMRNAEN
jgi:hypothetical protein